MTAEAGAFLRKARESLASAEADLGGERFNSAASRGYYAAFQAAISLLIRHGIQRRGRSWDHRFVMSEVSGKLIARREVLPAQFAGKLELLLTSRLVADYAEVDVGRRQATRSVREANAFVREAAKLEKE